jgi:hypothetical protein
LPASALHFTLADMDATDERQQETPAAAVAYVMELLITFEIGMGVTHEVSRDEVSFTTRAALVPGQHLVGELRFPSGEGEAGTVLRYVGKVTRVRQPYGPDGPFEVKAQLEQVVFVAGIGAPV